MIEVYKCGTKATFSEMACTIVGKEIRFDKVTYQLAYFYQGEYKTVWLHETEFIVGKNETQKIGFK